MSTPTCWICGGPHLQDVCEKNKKNGGDKTPRDAPPGADARKRARGKKKSKKEGTGQFAEDTISHERIFGDAFFATGIMDDSEDEADSDQDFR